MVSESKHAARSRGGVGADSCRRASLPPATMALAATIPRPANRTRDTRVGKTFMAEHTVERSSVGSPSIEEPWGIAAAPRLKRATPLTRTWSRFGALSLETKFLYVLLLVFIAKGILFTLVFPAFTGHDEVAHYAYLRYVAVDHRVPIVPDLTKWREKQAKTPPNQDVGEDRMPGELYKYCRYTTPDWWCSPDDPRFPDGPKMVTLGGKYLPSGWVYTANHPPLYYMLMTPLYWASQSQSPEVQLYVMRLAAIPFGLLTVLFAFLTVRVLFPADQFLLMMVPAFVALQPQISYESAMLNNDILAICVMSAILYVLARGLRNGFRWSTCVLVGALLGIGLISKTTTITAAPIIALAMIAGLGWRNVKEWVLKGAAVIGVTGLFAWPWYLFMWLQYHDLTALTQIKALQYWNYSGGHPPTVLGQLLDEGFAWMRWKETWGEFGWRLIPLRDNLLTTILFISFFAVAGLAVYVIRAYRHRRHAVEDEDSVGVVARGGDPLLRLDRAQTIGLVMMLATCVAAYYAVLQFGTTFSLTQARYYFPAVNAAALLLMFGLRAWFPMKWQPYVQAAVFAGLVLLNLLVFAQYVIPYWNPSI